MLDYIVMATLGDDPRLEIESKVGLLAEIRRSTWNQVEEVSEWRIHVV